jgi:hypothetical protein
MYQMLRLTVAAIAVAFVTFPASVSAQIVATQIKLTEKHVEGFIAAQKGLSAVVEKMQSEAFSGQANAKYQAELEAVTKRYGFKDFKEYEAVAANIYLVMAQIDPKTKVFTDPQTAIKKEIEEVSADKIIPDGEKRQLLKQLNQTLKSAESIQFPSNIELVQKYYDKIDVTTIATYDGDSPSTSTVVRTISE